MRRDDETMQQRMLPFTPSYPATIIWETGNLSMKIFPQKNIFYIKTEMVKAFARPAMEHWKADILDFWRDKKPGCRDGTLVSITHFLCHDMFFHG